MNRFFIEHVLSLHRTAGMYPRGKVPGPRHRPLEPGVQLTVAPNQMTVAPNQLQVGRTPGGRLDGQEVFALSALVILIGQSLLRQRLQAAVSNPRIAHASEFDVQVLSPFGDAELVCVEEKR